MLSSETPAEAAVTQAAPPVIEVSNLTKRYGEIVALDRVSFSLHKGHILGFLGPNGAGKTTTMRILTGYLAPTSGDVRVAGFDILTHPREVRRRIGYLPETPPLYDDMVVEDYLKFVGRIKDVPRSTLRQRVQDVADKCGLGTVRGRLIRNLSKGFRQRVGLAQALLNEPEVLILDEPTIGLDPNQIIEIRRLIKSLAGQHTIILSTHILPEVMMTCDKIVIISRGRVVLEESLEHITSQHRSLSRVQFRVAHPQLDNLAALTRVSGVHSVTPVQEDNNLYLAETDGSPATLEALARELAGWGLLEFGPVEVNLEEIYLKHTSGEIQGDAGEARRGDMQEGA